MRLDVCFVVLIAGLTLVGGLLGVGAASHAMPAEDATIVWETDLDAARAKAAETGRPLMVVFR